MFDETEIRVPCNMGTPTNLWIRVAWENEYWKEQKTPRREAEDAMRSVNIEVTLNKGNIMFEKDCHTDRE